MSDAARTLGSAAVARLAAAHMARNEPEDEERGVIISTASIAAFEGQIGQVAYTAAKAGLVGLSRALALEVVRHGVTVNVVSPGSIASEALTGWAESVGVDGSDPYALMIRKDDLQFKALVDETLAKLMRSGEFEKLYTQWFERPIPPRAISIQLPMSDALKQDVKDLDAGLTSREDLREHFHDAHLARVHHHLESAGI